MRRNFHVRPFEVFAVFSCFACACVYRLCTNAATYDSLARRFYQLAWPSLATQDQVLDRLGFLHGTPAVFLEVFLENARIEERQVARPKTRFWIANSGSLPQQRDPGYVPVLGNRQLQ